MSVEQEVSFSNQWQGKDYHNSCTRFVPLVRHNIRVLGEGIQCTAINAMAVKLADNEKFFPKKIRHEHKIVISGVILLPRMYRSPDDRYSLKEG